MKALFANQPLAIRPPSTAIGIDPSEGAARVAASLIGRMEKSRPGMSILMAHRRMPREVTSAIVGCAPAGGTAAGKGASG